MLYALLLFFYLLIIAMWLAFTELWSKRSAMTLWLTLVANSLKGSMILPFKPWYKKLMATPVYTQRNSERALLYYAARDFVHLDFEQKFNVGFQMGLCDHYDAMRNEDSLEDYIFEKVVRDRVLEDFVAAVRRMKHDAQSS